MGHPKGDRDKGKLSPPLFSCTHGFGNRRRRGGSEISPKHTSSSSLSQLKRGKVGKRDGGPLASPSLSSSPLPSSLPNCFLANCSSNCSLPSSPCHFQASLPPFSSLTASFFSSLSPIPRAAALPWPYSEREEEQLKLLKSPPRGALCGIVVLLCD